MTRNELRGYVKKWFNSRGFQSQKSYLFKVLDGDYLLGFYMEPTGLSKAYMFTCGIIYLPDNIKLPFHGVFDLQWDFIFPWEPNDEFDIHLCLERQKYRGVFKYEDYSIEQLEEILTQNYNYYITPLFDKEYGLCLFRDDWRLMNRFSVQSIEKLCNRAGLDVAEVRAFLKK